MKLLYTLLLMGPAAAPADGAAQQPSAWPTILMFGAIILVMWLFMIRPQRKQQKEMQEFRNSLKKGDKVVTVGGIYGEIVEVNEKTVLIRVDGDVKLRVDKQGLVKDYSDAEQK
jgi:preprotein translocase subunit YajC